jgi:septation ring formation regulator EzrA
MALITITEAAKSFDVSRSTLYEKIKNGELTRNSDKLLDTADLLSMFGEPGQQKSTHSDSAQINSTNALTSDFLETINSKDRKIDDLRAQLDDTRKRLNEHREAARLLESKEDDWKQSLAERQKQVDEARTEAGEIRESELQAQRELEAWKKQSWLDRVLGKEPKLAES